MMAPPFDPDKPAPESGPTSRRRKEPEPTPAQITKAVAFLNQALAKGPRLTREVEAEAKQQGHAKRTLDRARSQLHVKKIPPAVFGGPWQIALQNDPAVAAYQQRKETKHQQARQRQGNGQKGKKQNRDGRKQHGQVLTSTR